jgi:hypothetical protein
MVRKQAVIKTIKLIRAYASQHHFGCEYCVTSPPIMQPATPPKPLAIYTKVMKSWDPKFGSLLD